LLVVFVDLFCDIWLADNFVAVTLCVISIVGGSGCVVFPT
jgi:hypothetical protein